MIAGTRHEHSEAEEARKMAQVQRQAGGGGGGLAEVIDLILEKGLVIDAWVRVSLVGIEILTVQARVVVASVDTYLRYADAVAATATAAAPQAPPPA
jgi:hypothetical protein